MAFQTVQILQEAHAGQVTQSPHVRHLQHYIELAVQACNLSIQINRICIERVKISELLHSTQPYSLYFSNFHVFLIP
jgi:hypothetical protein